MTIGDKFFLPGLMHYLGSYIKGCHICQLFRNDKPPVRQLQTRINLNYRPLSRLSKHLKGMPRSYKHQKYILCIIDDIHQSRSKEIGETLIGNVLKILCAWLYNNGPG